MKPARPEAAAEIGDFDDPTMRAISDLLVAFEDHEAAKQRLMAAFEAVPESLRRAPRVMVGFSPDGPSGAVPIFVGSEEALNATMNEWAATLRKAGGTEKELMTVDLIRSLLHDDLKADRERLAAGGAVAGVPEAAKSYGAACDKWTETQAVLNSVQPSTLRGAAALAQFVAVYAREGLDHATFAPAARQLEKALAEMSGSPAHRES